MTDNLFDRLADLLRSPGPVNWRLAREIAESIAGPAQPIDPWAAEQFHDLAATAQRLVAAGSPLDPAAAVDGVAVVDRRTWASSNVEALAYIAEPVAERLSALEGMGPAMQPITAPLLGMQAGALIGFTSQRVLGQFDTGLAAGEPTSMAFVAPNVARLAEAHGLDEQQVRMWAALHEVTHHSELAIPWVREHLVMLGHAHAEELEVDGASMAEQLRLLQDPGALQDLIEGPGGLPELDTPIVAGEPLGRIAAFMAMLAGYADVIVERTGGPYLPDLGRIRDAANEHRASGSDSEQMLLQALGITLDPDIHDSGAAFCRDVARRWGDESLDRVWEGPETLPTVDELADPTGWAARVLL